MDKKYLFRADSTYKEGESITCKDPKSKKRVHDHVTYGTTRKTRFISTTGELSVAAMKFSLGEPKLSSPKRAPIVLIDFEKLRTIKQQEQAEMPLIYDFTDEEQVEEHLQGNTPNLARADREVVIDTIIPAECCKEIPPLLVDILLALKTEIGDDVETRHSKGELLEVGESIYDSILEMIMQGDSKLIERIVSKIEFNELEKRFMTLYYDKMQTLESVSKTMFGDLEHGEFLANAILNEIIKKIYKSQAIAQEAYYEKEIYSKIDPMKDWELYDKKMKMVTEFQVKIAEAYISPHAWGKNTMKEIKHNYDGYKWTQRVSTGTMKFENRKQVGKKFRTTRNLDGEGKSFFGTIFLDIAQKNDIIFPTGMDYKIEDGIIISAIPQCTTFGFEHERKN